MVTLTVWPAVKSQRKAYSLVALFYVSSLTEKQWRCLHALDIKVAAKPFPKVVFVWHQAKIHSSTIYGKAEFVRSLVVT